MFVPTEWKAVFHNESWRKFPELEMYCTDTEEATDEDENQDEGEDQDQD